MAKRILKTLEEIEALHLECNQRILLSIGHQADALPELLNCAEMLDPQKVQRLEQDPSNDLMSAPFANFDDFGGIPSLRILDQPRYRGLFVHFHEFRHRNRSGRANQAVIRINNGLDLRLFGIPVEVVIFNECGNFALQQAEEDTT